MSDNSSCRFVKAGVAADVSLNAAKVFAVEKKRILVCNVEGALYAVEDRCSHDNAPLDNGELDDYEIECPRHGARFDVRSGKALCLPATRAIETYAVEVRGDELWIGLPDNG